MLKQDLNVKRQDITMEIKQIKFQFKGARNYVHGTDMFNTMIAAYADEKSLSNIRFSVHGFVHKLHCQLYAADTKEALNSVPDVRARCQFDKNGSTKWLVLTENDGDTALDERYEYDEDRVISLCSMETDSIILTQKSPFSFIETIVAMNKQLHQQLFPEVIGKWVFTQIDLETDLSDRENLALRFMHNMNYRLTKSDILVNGTKVGNLFFSLVKS